MQRRPDDHSLLKRRECTSEAVEIVFMRRQPEAQQIIGPLETPAPDALRKSLFASPNTNFTGRTRGDRIII